MYAYHQYSMKEHYNDQHQSQTPFDNSLEKCTPYGLPFGKICLPARRPNRNDFIEDEDSSFQIEEKSNESCTNSVDNVLQMIDEQLASQSRSSPLTARGRHYSRFCPSVQGLPHPSELRRKKAKEIGSFKPGKDLVVMHMQQLHRKRNEMLDATDAPASIRNEATPQWDGTPLCVRVQRAPNKSASSEKEAHSSIALQFDSEDEQDMIFQPKLLKMSKTTGNNCRSWWQTFYAEE